ncbi:MAG: O-antigen ligase family protein [Acidobacteriota bacterium]
MDFIDFGTFGGRAVGWAPERRDPPVVRTRAAHGRQIREAFYVVPIVRWAFYLFIATIPFETTNLGVPVEITAISLGLLLLSLAFQIPVVFHKPPLAYGLFFLYLAIFAAPLILTESEYTTEAIWQLFVLTQLMVMSWVAYNLTLSDRVARNAALSLGAACTLLAVLQLSGITTTASDEAAKIERVTALGFHPNNVARIFALGILAFVGLAAGAKKGIIRPRWVVWIAFALMGISLVQTGSRGGILALGAGLSAFILRAGSIAVKARNIMLVLFALTFFVVAALQSDVMRERLDNTLENGDLARRDQIYPVAWGMFLEKPLFGWGNQTGEYELGARLAHVGEDSKNPHNLILHLFLVTGIAGAVPMLVGLGLAVWAAWKSRLGPRGVLPLSLIVTVIVANMSGLWLHNKMHWLVVALALSSYTAVRRRARSIGTSDSISNI